MSTWEPETEQTYIQVWKWTAKSLKRTGAFKGQIAIPTKINKSKHITNVKIGRRISEQIQNDFWAVSL